MAGNDKELKSAFDIAMERAEKLGGLSAEDKRKLKKEELSEIGQALGKRYLSGLPIRDVELELGKYIEDRQIIVRYIVSSLVDKINLTDTADVEKILEAVHYFLKSDDVVESIRGLVNEYQTSLQRARQGIHSKLGTARKKELAEKGISGSAVEPAIETSPEWLEAKLTLDAKYEERLKGITSPLQTL